MIPGKAGNVDPQTVEGFGEEWAAFTQEQLGPDEQKRLFDQYFSVFPFDRLPGDAEGFDLGCGTGRWAALVAERVGRLHCIDPAAKALAVARRRLGGASNVLFHERDVDHLPLADGSQDFGYSIGVLHHIPDTQSALAASVAKLKPGAPFLVYLYYAFDNRPAWFRSLWRLSEVGRRGISRLPFGARRVVTGLIAAPGLLAAGAGRIDVRAPRPAGRQLAARRISLPQLLQHADRLTGSLWNPARAAILAGPD